jgi:cell division protein FtsB
VLKTNIKRYYQLGYEQLDRFRDVRFTGLIAFGVVVLLVSWSGVKAIGTNYNLQKQIVTLQQQNDIQSLVNTNTQLQNEYYNTNQYLELSARQSFGLALPGETELIVPSSVALTYTTPLPKSTMSTTIPASSQPFYSRDFQAWVDFFFHRKS